MYKLYDYMCPNDKCEDHLISQEFLIDYTKENVICSKCYAAMEPALSYAQGKVKGGTPRFHKNSRGK